MKTPTKIIIFLIVAIIIVIGITLATQSAVAPTVSPVATSTAVTSASPVAEKTYTLAQIAQHKTPADCWTTVNGGVYNLTPFVNEHPGGVMKITQTCGIDETALFMAQHGGQGDPQKELATLKIGILIK